MSEHKGTEFGTAMSALIGVVLLIAVVYALTVGQFSGGGSAGAPEQVAERIAPIGSVTLAGADGAAPTVAAAAGAAGDEGPGTATYTQFCSACHAAGVAGAPKLGDKAAWEQRLAAGIDQLLATAIQGKGAMPPRGTCAACSDDDLRAVIEYMLVQVGYEPAGSFDAAEAPAMEGMSGMQGTSGMSGMSGVQAETAAPAAPASE